MSRGDSADTTMQADSPADRAPQMYNNNNIAHGVYKTRVAKDLDAGAYIRLVSIIFLLHVYIHIDRDK